MNAISLCICLSSCVTKLCTKFVPWKLFFVERLSHISPALSHSHSFCVCIKFFGKRPQNESHWGDEFLVPLAKKNGCVYHLYIETHKINLVKNQLNLKIFNNLHAMNAKFSFFYSYWNASVSFRFRFFLFICTFIMSSKSLLGEVHFSQHFYLSSHFNKGNDNCCAHTMKHTFACASKYDNEREKGRAPLTLTEERKKNKRMKEMKKEMVTVCKIGLYSNSCSTSVERIWLRNCLECWM